MLNIFTFLHFLDFYIFWYSKYSNLFKLLEFVVLSRLTNDNVFEEKVLKTMDYLWEKRNKASDLVGTVINVNDGEWAVKDASIGAGIDSYYEYLFKVSHWVLKTNIQAKGCNH